MRILVTPSFARRAKRLHANQKKSLDKAIRAIGNDVAIGEEKVGDLVGFTSTSFHKETKSGYLLIG